VLCFHVPIWANQNTVQRDTAPRSSQSAQPGRLEDILKQQSERRIRTGATRGLARDDLGEVSAPQLIQMLASKSVQPNTRVLIYSLDDGALHTWLISKEGIVAEGSTQVDASALDRWTNALGRALNVQRAGVRAPRLRNPPKPPAVDETDLILEPELALRRISTMVFPSSLSSELRKTDHLIIVPWGNIGTLPFAALMPFADRTQTIDHFSVAIAPSVSELVAPKTNRPWEFSAAIRRPLIIGNPKIPRNGEWIVPPLPGAENEAHAIARQIQSVAITGAEATKDLVSRAAPGATLIYLATHGVADPANPLDAGLIMLAGPSASASNWTAREIQTTNLANVDLVVLSACQTGLGGFSEGGVIGLARAFQLAGASNVAMSLWSIDDDATVVLMTEFMTNLATQRPPDAMRKAMLKARDNFSDPALWGAFLVLSTGR
jgi:CHAT domain-containing protein